MPDPSSAPLSVAIIAKDEADRIGACLESLSVADEVVVVVDRRSQDDTTAIARAHGCRVMAKSWMGYAKQKQFAVDACENEWVLILDADERIPPPTATALRGVLTRPDHAVAAYGFSRKNFFHGRWFKRCDWWPDEVVRLVNRDKGHFSDTLVHEQWVAHGPVKQLDAVIEHHSFRNFADLIEKMQNYSTLAARQMKDQGRRVGWWTPISHGLWTFMRSYWLELGVLEGFDGFVVSTTNAGGSFMKYAKLWELWHHRDAR